MPTLPQRPLRHPEAHHARLAAADPIVRPLPLSERLDRLALARDLRDRILLPGRREGVASLADPAASGLVRALQMDGVDAVFCAVDQGSSVRFTAPAADLSSAHVDVRLDLAAGAVYVFDFDVTATRSDALYPQSYLVEVYTSGSTGAPLLQRTEGLTAPDGHLLASYVGAESRSYALVRLSAVGPTVTYWSFRSCTVSRSAA